MKSPPRPPPDRLVRVMGAWWPFVVLALMALALIAMPIIGALT